MIRAMILVNVILLISLTGILTLEPTPVVRTNVGPIQGEILKTPWHSLEYSSFRAIPYAKPPIGNLRFKPPVRAEPWTEVLNATKESTECIQLPLVEGENFPFGSEDCLYLNVYTRETQFAGKLTLRPVMVYVHGGGFTVGYNRASVFGPGLLLEKDVVVVAMNYRLGPMGFLSLDHPDALGNAGLKDQVSAMRWVKENIAAFGGDPNSITIFGHSSGAASISYHLLSEQTRGLFHRSISLSGSPLADYGYYTPAEAIRRATKLGSKLGCETQNKNDLLKCLHKATAEQLVNANQNLTKSWFVPGFVPTKENVNLAPREDLFFTECPIQAFKTVKLNRNPHMMGYASYELISFAMTQAEKENFINYTTDILNQVINYNPESPRNPAIRDMIDSLPGPHDEGTVKIGSKVHFDAPIDLEQKLIVRSNKQKPVYYYKTSYDNRKYSKDQRTLGLTLNGTGHGDDLSFIFDFQNYLNASNDPNEPFNVFRAKVVQLFTNFAKYGNPTPKNGEEGALNFKWMASGKEGLQLDINEKFRMRSRLVNSETLNYENALLAALPPFTDCTDRNCGHLDD